MNAWWIMCIIVWLARLDKCYMQITTNLDLSHNVTHNSVHHQFWRKLSAPINWHLVTRRSIFLFFKFNINFCLSVFVQAERQYTTFIKRTMFFFALGWHLAKLLRVIHDMWKIFIWLLFYYFLLICNVCMHHKYFFPF